MALHEGGEEVAFILFNGRDSTMDSWFSKDRVLDSTWTDIKTETSNYFSIEGWGVCVCVWGGVSVCVCVRERERGRERERERERENCL